MRIKQIHPALIMPTKGSPDAAAFDLYMPESGETVPNETVSVKLGFASEFSKGLVALLLPRSSTGGKFGLELNNTVGVIDADYRGEWVAKLRTKNDQPFAWTMGDRVLQFILVPIHKCDIELVENLEDTDRATGGFGSTGQ